MAASRKKKANRKATKKVGRKTTESKKEISSSREKVDSGIGILEREQIVPYLWSLLLIGSGILVFFVYRSYAWPAFLSLLLYVGFGKVNRFLIKRWRGKRTLAAAATTLLVVLILVVPAVYLTVHLVEQLIDLVISISDALTSRRILYTLQQVPWITDYLTSNPFFWIDLIQMAESFSSDYASLLDTDRIGSWVSNVFNVVKGSVKVTSRFFADMLLTLVILFFLFRDGPGFYRFLERAMPFPTSMTNRFMERMRELIEAVLVGNVFVSFLQGSLLTLGLVICGISNSIVYGFIAAIFSLIPVIGTAVVWFPVALYLFARGEYALAVFISVYGISMYLLLENILKPKLLDKKLGMHPLLLFLAILGGLAEFGMSGVILGPLFVTLFMTMWKIYHVWGGESALVIADSNDSKPPRGHA